MTETPAESTKPGTVAQPYDPSQPPYTGEGVEREPVVEPDAYGEPMTTEPPAPESEQPSAE